MEVSIDGVVKYQYDYDENGNILVETVDNVDIVSSYDHQDRLINRGDKEYIFKDRGSLLKVIKNGSETIFDYDVFGNLLEIFCLAASPKRRLRSPRVGWAAFLDQNGEIESYFIYGTRSNVPEYMIKDGKKYKFVVDHLGSVRKVIDLDTKEVVQEIKYTPYGEILSDSNVQLLHPNADCDRLELDGQLFPNFQPFGYVGGIYDQDTGLIRYGARDYDPETHRWTSKEPLGFGGSMNFYGYCEGDPVNFVDVTGLKIGDMFYLTKNNKLNNDLLEKVMIDALQSIICDSIREEKEEGVVVKKYKDWNGDFYYKAKISSVKRKYNQVNHKFSLENAKATGHTHVFCGNSNNIINNDDFGVNEIALSEQFSDADMTYVDQETNKIKKETLPVYVITVLGNIRRWNPNMTYQDGYKGGDHILRIDLNNCGCGEDAKNNIDGNNPLCR